MTTPPLRRVNLDRVRQGWLSASLSIVVLVGGCALVIDTNGLSGGVGAADGGGDATIDATGPAEAGPDASADVATADTGAVDAANAGDAADASVPGLIGYWTLDEGMV
jgi:hypothetical protein